MKLKPLSTEPKKPYQYLLPSLGALHGCVQQLTQLAGCITVTLHIPLHGPRHVSCSFSLAKVR